jgi:molybdopterin/thiamine biosynthesis adenylyltransferase
MAVPPVETRLALSRTTRLISRAIFRGQLHESAIAAGLRGTRMRITADERNAGSHAGQCAAVCLFSLCARMGLQVELRVPDVPLCCPQPPVRLETLQAGLLELAADLIPGVGAYSPFRAEPDVTFLLGDTQAHAVSGYALRVQGDAWRGEARPVDRTPGVPWLGDWPLGAFAAAAAAAGEAFRIALVRIAREHGVPLPSGDDFSRRVSVGVDLRSAFPALAASLARQRSRRLDVRVDFVSGGAVSQAALFCLARVPGLTMEARAIEDQRLKLENLNRYMLSRRSQVGQPKTRVVSCIAREGLGLTGVRRRFEEATRAQIAPLAPAVVCGVDDISSRWAIQRERPPLLVVGATESFDVLVSSHRREGPCAGCLHTEVRPPAGFAPTISFVSFLAGLLAATSLLAHLLEAPPERQSLLCFGLGLAGEGLLPLPLVPSPRCPVACHASCRASEQASASL